MSKPKKQQKSVSIPPDYWKEIEELYEELTNYLKQKE